MPDESLLTTVEHLEFLIKSLEIDETPLKQMAKRLDKIKEHVISCKGTELGLTGTRGRLRLILGLEGKESYERARVSFFPICVNNVNKFDIKDAITKFLNPEIIPSQQSPEGMVNAISFVTNLKDNDGHPKWRTFKDIDGASQKHEALTSFIKGEIQNIRGRNQRIDRLGKKAAVK